MGNDIKYALLDTDFLFKSHLARDKKGQTLASLVISFKEYSFFCHSMIKEELSRHQIEPDPNPWLEKQIEDGSIKLYTDRDIIEELEKYLGDAAILRYLDFLKKSCDTFNSGFFEKYYKLLDDSKYTGDKKLFLGKLDECDKNIPHQNGIGEKKSYVLIQMLEFIYGDNVYVFCSDDFRARQSIAGLPKPVNCISILGVFDKLKKMGHEKSEMEPYYKALLAFLKNQTEFKVWNSGLNQRVNISKDIILDEIYDERFMLLRNGDLAYKN